MNLIIAIENSPLHPYNCIVSLPDKKTEQGDPLNGWLVAIARTVEVDDASLEYIHSVFTQSYSCGKDFRVHVRGF